jgi:hypothetical protein
MALASGRGPKARTDGSVPASSPDEREGAAPFAALRSGDPLARVAPDSLFVLPSGCTSHHCTCRASSIPPTAIDSVSGTSSLGSIGSESGCQVDPASSVMRAPRKSAMATARQPSNAAIRPT